MGLDYFFMTSGGIMKRGGLGHELDDDGEQQLPAQRAEGNIIKCIAIGCFNSKDVVAHCVHCKGADEEGYVADLVVKDILWLGHSELIVKGDNEPALQALIERSMHLIRVKVADGAPGTSLKRLSKEEPAPYDSQSN